MAEAHRTSRRDRRAQARRRRRAARRDRPRRLRARAEPTRRSLRAALGAAGRALHHGGEARLAVRRRAPRRGRSGAHRPGLSRRRRRDQRAHRRALFRRLARRSAAPSGATFPGRSSPRISSSIRARSPRPGCTAPTRCWSSSSVLDDAEAAAVMAEARRLGMDVLVEAHDEAEVRRAVALGAEIIGINNRDLDDDEGRPRRHRAARAPWCRPTAWSSPNPGSASRADVERLGAHADAFLVGSSLMARRGSRRGGAGARLRPGQGLRPHRRRRRGDGGRSMAPPMPAWSWCRARRARSAGARPRRSPRRRAIPLVGVFRNEKPMQVALRRPSARPARGPAPRRGGRALHQGAARPASARRPRSGPPPRSAASCPSRGSAPTAPCSTARSAAARGGTGIAFDWAPVRRPGRSCPAAPRRRPRPRQCRAPRRGSAPSRSTSARESRRRPAARTRASSPPSSRRFGRRRAGSAASC